MKRHAGEVDLDGEPYADALVRDEVEAAQTLARFVLGLRRIDPVEGAPRGGRTRLRELDAVTRETIESARGVIDRDAASCRRGHVEPSARLRAPRGPREHSGPPATNPGFVALAKRTVEEVLAG